jgi:NAD-dependent dihydropyrimidine dehydrogenase PreA subunit
MTTDMTYDDRADQVMQALSCDRIEDQHCHVCLSFVPPDEYEKMIDEINAGTKRPWPTLRPHWTYEDYEECMDCGVRYAIKANPHTDGYYWEWDNSIMVFPGEKTSDEWISFVKSNPKFADRDVYVHD